LTPGSGNEFVSYGGRFRVDESSSSVHHLVVISTLPELLTHPQIRHAQIDGERLTLSASATSTDGTTTHNTLVWRRDTES
jgi:hypothetical protein